MDPKKECYVLPALMHNNKSSLSFLSFYSLTLVTHSKLETQLKETHPHIQESKEKITFLFIKNIVRKNVERKGKVSSKWSTVLLPVFVFLVWNTFLYLKRWSKSVFTFPFLKLEYTSGRIKTETWLLSLLLSRRRRFFFFSPKEEDDDDDGNNCLHFLFPFSLPQFLNFNCLNFHSLYVAPL